MALLNETFDELSLFYENDSTVIFKGISKESNKRVILKSHKNQDEMFRIKHEYDLLTGKSIPGVSSVLDISYNDDKNYLVLEDNGAEVLDAYLSKYSIDGKSFLKIAQNAAEALATIHEQGIIHCDVKPANILIHPETLQVWFIDFGISFSTHQRDAKTEGFAGTLEYMAPEQTGRLNMVVDNRSDLYSLGITLYSMLTGVLPFNGETAVELIHAQTVLPPKPIGEYSDVSPTIAAIVHKLMEKAPRKRYQSAKSLSYDLGLCLSRLDETGNVEPFTLGEKDVFASLEPGRKLFGKEKQLEEMMGIFHSIPSNESALLLLHGPADAGKSNLLQAFVEYVEQNNGYLLKGSFDWKDNPEPYSAIREAFEGFELYAYNQNLPLPEYRNRILEAVGENAQVLLDIIPSLEPVFGKQPPVMKLTPLESQARAREVFKKAIEIICDAPYPYILVFDDVQWADDNTLQMLLSAIEGKNVGNCIMVLSYQDDDPAFLNRLSALTHRLDRKTLTVTDVGVTYLNKEDITSLVGEFFDEDSPQARELVDILYSSTKGVVSKIHMYLQLMYRSKQIQYDAESDSWSLNFDNLDANVLQEIENKYKQVFDSLPADKQEMLAKLACMGENFNIEEAALVYDCDPDDFGNLVEDMAELRWLVRDRKLPMVFSFAHKTVYDLCYGYYSQEERNRCHLQVVTRLYEKYQADPDEMLKRSTLFTRQILAAPRSLFDETVLHDISRYKLTAAEQIMEAANMEQAAKTFANGLLLLGETPFATNYALAYELHLNYAMCCFALHKPEQATELFEKVLEHAETEQDRYNAYFKIVTQYLSTAEWENAKLYCKRYLAEEKLLLPEDQDPIEAGDREYERFRQLTGKDGIMICCTYEQTEDVLLEHHGNMLAMLSDALLFNLDDDKCKYYLYRTINLSVEHKEIFSEFTRTFCVAAARYASVGDYNWAKHLIETGLQYAEKNHTGQAFLWCVYGNMITHWVNPLSETTEIYKKAKYYALMEGNAFYEAYADMMLLNYHSFIGENLDEYHQETQATLHNLERSGLNALRANFRTFRQYARCLMGRTESPDSFDDIKYKEASLEEIRGTWNGTFNDIFFYVYRLRALYIHEYYEKAAEYAEKYVELMKTVNTNAYITKIQFHYYYCMTLLELCKKYPERQAEYLETIHENHKFLKTYAKVNPLNFEYKNMLVTTEIKGLSSDSIELVDEYATEHRGFLAKGLIWDAVFVERLIAHFWQKRNIPQYVIIHKRNALKHYKDIGAKHLIRKLADVDDAPVHHEKHHTTYMSSTMNTTFFSTNYTRGGATQYSGINVALDFQALLQVLEELIKMDTLPSLNNHFLQLLLQNGNAEKALLFLEDGSAINLVSAKYVVDSETDFNNNELPVDVKIVEDSVLPKRLIELAKSKNEVLAANSARNEYRLIGDAYLNKHSPESFLCMPVSAKGKHLGVVYLENASLAGSFPDGRVRYLQAIVLQASVLILNLQNVAVMEDYTKDLERRLSSYLAQQNALIAGIAHEINSPVGVCLTVSTKMHEKTVAVIDAFSRKALGKSALEKYLEETRDGVNIINNNIVRAGDLVSNFKQMSVEQSTEVFETLELAPTIRNIVEYIRPGVKKKIDKVHITVPEDLRIYSSSGVLAQIFTNLIMNSAIHGFELMDKDQCHSEIVVTELDNRDEIEICYSDNGKGMNEEELEKVFQPFFTTKRNRGGSGLGGHIILTLVTQTLNGSVRCISAPGEGTTFVIRLPKYKKEENQKEV